jgi:hypothetical protein
VSGLLPTGTATLLADVAGSTRPCLTDAIGDGLNSGRCRICLGSAQLFRGDVARAVTQFGEVVVEAEAAHVEIYRVVGTWLQGSALAYQGAAAAARAAGELAGHSLSRSRLSEIGRPGNNLGQPLGVLDRITVGRHRRALDLASSNRWWVGAAHLPFPGLGHRRRDPHRYTWVPVTFAPIETAHPVPSASGTPG